MNNDDLQQVETEQTRLASLVVRQDEGGPFDRLTGVDVAYFNDSAIAAAATTDLSGTRLLSVVTHSRPHPVEYRSGYLQLREGPVLLELLRTVRDPGIVLVDGNGILHPRRCGLASYLGVRLDLVSIGVAKRLMCGTSCDRQENIAYIVDRGETLGAAVWLNNRPRPVYVSIGHRISLDTSIRVVINCSHRGQPEPIRLAHEMARALSREMRHE